MYEEEVIFVSNFTHPSCHASTIVELPNGDLACAWYAGTSEGAKDVAIFLSIKRKNNKTCFKTQEIHCPKNAKSNLTIANNQSPPLHYQNKWSTPEIVVDTPGHSEGNPVLFTSPDNKLWLFYVTMFGTKWDECKVFYKTAVANQLPITFGSPITLQNELGWMTRNKPIILKHETSNRQQATDNENYTILLPLYDERKWHSFVLISYNSGKHWKKYGDISSPFGVIQPTVVELEDGKLLMFMRTGFNIKTEHTNKKIINEGFIWKSYSFNGGKTWSQAKPTNLPNPNSGIDMVKLKSGKLVLAFNNSSTARSPLNVAISDDEGENWLIKTVEDRPGEYSYPAIIQSSDGLIHLVYTNRRVNIKHITFSEDWFYQSEQ